MLSTICKCQDVCTYKCVRKRGFFCLSDGTEPKKLQRSDLLLNTCTPEITYRETKSVTLTSEVTDVLAENKESALNEQQSQMFGGS